MSGVTVRYAAPPGQLSEVWPATLRARHLTPTPSPSGALEQCCAEWEPPEAAPYQALMPRSCRVGAPSRPSAT